MKKDWPFLVGMALFFLFVMSNIGGHNKPKEQDYAVSCQNNGSITTKTRVGDGISCGVANTVSMIIKMNGYKCSDMEYVRKFIAGGGYKVGCDKRYDYEVEDRGGKWIVTVK